ncbi:hypothetical protein [Lentiprolixibacter aurantiacus]|uniref:Polysaccharide biosynthesis protein C-terminal domain-containing protein n=1 Tax=Lentiprolixibacter aurantiacus TaxID=2993939 RepID=A0AAE3SMQ5_9FLAO|nr:hypothetical protein [Lentiprolixibacter aurantiacus]MCX2718546.1 hypothetical protein [Lentiprolixibacter aurantiacus]
MAISMDFLTKEIFVKVFTTSMVLLRAAYLLYFFGATATLDSFFLAKAIVGLVALVSILFEIVYSSKLVTFKHDLNFIKKYNIYIGRIALLISVIALALALISGTEKLVIINMIILSIWAIISINSNYYLLIYRYQLKNKRVLFYYSLLSLLDVVILVVLHKLNIFGDSLSFLALAMSLVMSEAIVFLLLFSKYTYKVFSSGQAALCDEKLPVVYFFKVLGILVVITLIDITDKYFLSFMGEGSIVYYVYGLKAPLIIRQSLDIKSNFFVQINELKTLDEVRQVFFKTLKRLAPFFMLAALVLVIVVEVFGSAIISFFKLDNLLLLKKIIYIGVITVLFYMVWDLFYRYYYRSGKIDLLLKVAFIGFVLNIIFNYIFAISLKLEVLGVLISTFSIYCFYTVVSYYNLIGVNRKNG